MPRVRRSRTSSRNSLTIMALMPGTIGAPRRISQRLMKFGWRGPPPGAGSRRPGSPPAYSRRQRRSGRIVSCASIWWIGGVADSTRHAGRWTLEDRFASPWHYLPVEVGPEAAGLRVELEYERAGG